MKRFGKLSLSVGAAALIAFAVTAFSSETAQAGGFSFSFGVAGPAYGPGCYDYAYRPAAVHVHHYHRPRYDWGYHCAPRPPRHCPPRPICW